MTNLTSARSAAVDVEKIPAIPELEARCSNVIPVDVRLDVASALLILIPDP